MKRLLVSVLFLLATVLPAEAAIQFDFLLAQARTATTSLAGGRVYFYAPGTTTPATVWLDSGQTTPASNPYTLDANGTAQLYGNGMYRVVIKDPAGVTRFDRDKLAYFDVMRSAGAVNVDTLGGLAAAIDAYAISGTTVTLQVTTPQTLSTTKIVPANVTLQVVSPGVITGSGNLSGLRESNPRWFGAKGDGVTNDLVAEQKSIDALASSGGRWIVPPGDYYSPGQLNLKSNMYVIGYGKASHIFNTSGGYNNAPNMLVATSQHDITVEQVWVENSHYGQAFPPVGTFTGMGVNLLFIDCDNAKVLNSYFSGGGGYIGGNDQGVAPVYFSKCRNCIASGNTVWDSQNGILADDWYSGGSSTTRGVTFSNNTVFNMGRTGIVVDLSGGGTATVTGNIIRQFTQQGMEINNVANVTITGNTIDGDPTGRTQSNALTSGQTTWYGLRGIFVNEISTVQTRNLVVTGNAISNILYTPIQAYDVLNADISHNPIYNYTGSSTVNGAAIRLYSSNAARPYAKVSISDNPITAIPAGGATVDGIVVDMFDPATVVKSLSIRGNDISGVNNRGVNKPYAGTDNSSETVSFNTIRGNADGVITGIYWNGITNGRMEGNITHNCLVGLNVVNSAKTYFGNTSDNDTTGMSITNSDTPIIDTLFIGNTTAMSFAKTGADNIIGDATGSKYIGVTTVKARTATGARVLFNVTAIPSIATAPPDEVGDRAINISGTVGQPKAWLWTGGVWTSEGNL